MAGNLAGLFQLDPAWAFLNHGSYGACPVRVFEAYQGWQRALERQPVAFLEPSRGYTARLRTVREAVAAEVGAQADDLVGVSNATEALNIAAQSLELGPGDEVLTTDHEYAALEKTWAHVCRRAGAKVVVAEVPLPLVSEAAFCDAILGAMTARTRVLFLSHVTSATALVFPLAGVVAEARARGIVTVIDGAHGPGLVPLALDALGADFYAGNCHKWWMAPKGAAFLHVRRERQAGVVPLVISHGWTADAAEPGPFGNSAFVDRLEMRGTGDPSAWLSVADALRFRHEQGWARVAADCAALAQEVAGQVRELTGLPAISSPEFCAPQMVAMPVPECDVAALKAHLEGLQVEVPCYRWRGRSLVRVSVQGYTDRADLERLVAGLEGYFGW
jgi:isopenicillin-N epimerase